MTGGTAKCRLVRSTWVDHNFDHNQNGLSGTSANPSGQLGEPLQSERPSLDASEQADLRLLIQSPRVQVDPWVTGS